MGWGAGGLGLVSDGVNCGLDELNTLLLLHGNLLLALIMFNQKYQLFMNWFCIGSLLWFGL